jgi:ribosome-associated translation inhibitor RaiA
MKIALSAPKLTAPTYETLREICEKKVNQLRRLLGVQHYDSALLSVSCRKNGDEFEIVAKLSDGVFAIAKSSDRDLRKAASNACSILKSRIAEEKDKKKG